MGRSTLAWGWTPANDIVWQFRKMLDVESREAFDSLGWLAQHTYANRWNSERPVVEHEHGRADRARSHSHAYGSITHSHLLRAICREPECAGCATHNIHPKSK